MKDVCMFEKAVQIMNECNAPILLLRLLNVDPEIWTSADDIHEMR